MKTKNTENEYPPTPELDKMKRVKPISQKIGEFLEWLQEDYTIAQYDSESDVLFATPLSIELLLAKYFAIDLQKVEEERRAVLAWHRKQSK